MKPALLISLTLLAASLPAHAQSGLAASDAAVRSIVAGVFTGNSMAQLENMADTFGARLAATQGYDDAANWAAAQFRSYGIDDVRQESFTIPSTWQRGASSAELVAPLHRALHLQSVGWAPSTPPGGVEGEVVIVTDLAPKALDARADAIRGHIVLLDTNKTFAAGFNQTYADLKAAYQRFRSLGVPLLILPDAVPNNVLGDWTDVDNGDGIIQPLPMAELGMEDALLIRRLLDHGPVRLHAAMQNTIGGPATVHNVVAELHGTSNNGEWIVVSGHLDTWDLATGAQDNGTGVAMVLDSARVIAALPSRPLRSIRFILFNGEEPGILGSRNYVRQHAGELDRCVAVLNSDNGVGHPKGWKVAGRQDLADALAPIEKAYLAPFGATATSLEATFDTDHGPFYLHGIPALDLWVDMAHYQDIHHKSSDTFDKIDELTFHADTAVLAIGAYIVSNMPQPIARHIDHAAVAEILKQANLTGYLVAHGDWEP